MSDLVSWDGGMEGMIGRLGRATKPRGVLTTAGRRIGNLAMRQYKITHRWNNRTYTLESSIGVHVMVTGSLIVVTVYAGAYYGIYVETRWGGRYSSLMPALYAVLPEAQRSGMEAFMGGFS